MDHASHTNTAGGNEGMLFVFNAAHAICKISGARLSSAMGSGGVAFTSCCNQTINLSCGMEVHLVSFYIENQSNCGVTLVAVSVVRMLLEYLESNCMKLLHKLQKLLLNNLFSELAGYQSQMVHVKWYFSR